MRTITTSMALIAFTIAIMWSALALRPYKSQVLTADLDPATPMAETVLKSARDSSIVVLRHSDNLPCRAVELAGRSVLEARLPPDSWDIAIVDPAGDWLYFPTLSLPPGSLLHIGRDIGLVTNGSDDRQPALPRPVFVKNGEYEIVMSTVLDIDIEDIHYLAWCRVRYTSQKRRAGGAKPL